MLDKDLLVERLKSEGFSKTAEKVQRESVQETPEGTKETGVSYNTQKSE